MRIITDAAQARLTGRPVTRFTYECAQACHRGTDDPREFESHVAQCAFVQPGVRELVAKAIARGQRIAVEPLKTRATTRDDLTIDMFPGLSDRPRQRNRRA